MKCPFLYLVLMFIGHSQELLKINESDKRTLSGDNFINTEDTDFMESDESEENVVPKSLEKSRAIQLHRQPRSGNSRWRPHSDKPQHVPDSTPLYSKKDGDVHPGEASTWGKGLYKTFDNHMFSFKSFCNFTFCRHCVESGREFNIEMARNRNGKIDRIAIVLDGNVITVKDGKILVKHKYVQLPYDNKMVHIKKYGDYTKLESRRGILTLLWNDEDKFSITLHKKYETCGLCGSHHAGRDIDVVKLIRDSKIPDATCPEPVIEQGVHCDEGKMYCHSIISKYFKSCKAVGKLYHEYERLCTEEYCKTGSGMDVCSTLLELARECSSGGSGPFEAWRRDPDVVCVTPACPEPKIYRDCGPSNQATCSYMSLYQDAGCVSGCVCPEGYVVDDIGENGKCIEKRKCACKFDGKVYRPGEKRKGPCNSECTCQDAKWACTESLCPGRCSVEGPFITTFDGISYTYAGDCDFVAIQHKDWSLSVELRPCHNGPAETCLKSVSLALGLPLSADKYIFHNNGSFFNDKIKHRDYYASDTIVIFRRSSSYIEAQLYFGLNIQIQLVPTMQVYATLPAKKYTNTGGLCGSFNNKAEDEFMSSQNILEVTPEAFARSWEMMTCPKARQLSCASIEKENFAKINCAVLTDANGVFAAGHSIVDYRSYYEKCLMSTCVCEDIKDCLCTALGNYVKACTKHGVYITDWRRGMCEQKCEEGKVFQYNAKACNTSCRSFSERDLSCDVEDSPVDGCLCPEGLYLNSKGMCVNRDACDCYMDNQVLLRGQHIDLNNYTCVCRKGQLFCHNPTDLKPVTCEGGAEFMTCSDPKAKRRIEKTCTSLNVPHLSTDMPCSPGCYCPLDMVRDHEGKCILPTSCPCSYSGRRYEQGSLIKIACNTCTCVEGTWECAANKCQSSCHIYGDGQIQTFDGKWYSYDGLCQYVLAEDFCGKEHGSFRVLTESIPCCEDGITCSRKITVVVEGGTLVLEDGKFMFTKDAGSTKCTDKEPYTVHTVGLYLIIRFTHGITLIWDKNTRVSITMDSNWNKQTCGLCGNHNGKILDEFTTRVGSLAAGPVEFGNSWKTSPMCSDTVSEIFPCDANAYCKTWAVRKCEIIMDQHFRVCHNKVDPTPYHKACIEEACVCTMEGKYHGFCTAVSMYAEACAAAGVCITWRTPELCPVFCDYYNAPGECSWHYRPCGSMTTKTCKQNAGDWALPSVLEGCYAKCPEHAPYLDENTMKCVRLSDCTCYHNEVVLPGQFIYDECGRLCVCRSGDLECSELPFVPRFGDELKMKNEAITIPAIATTRLSSTHMIGTRRNETEEKTSGFVGPSQTMQRESFTEDQSATVWWDTGVPGNATGSAERLTKATAAVDGHATGTGIHITSSAIHWNTDVTRRPTEHVQVRSSTESRESVTIGTDGGVEPSTFVPPQTSRSGTSSLGQQSTDVTSQPTEHTAARSSPEGSKSVTTRTDGGVESSTFVHPKTSRSMTSSRVQQSTDVSKPPTEHAAAGNSTEGSKSVTTGTDGGVESSTFVHSKTSRSMTSSRVQQSTDITRQPTEHTAVRSSTEGKESVTTGTVGDVKHSSFFPPKTSRSVTSRLVQQSTDVIRKPAEHTAVRSSTEGSKSVTIGTDGGVEPSTFVPPKTSRSVTSSLVQQSTAVTRKITEHTAVRSKTEGSKSVTSETAGDAEPFTFVPPKTSRGVTSRLVQQSTDVTRKPTEHTAVRSSTEGKESVTIGTVGDVEPSSFFPPKTSRSVTSRLVQQSTVVTRKPAEHTAVRSSTEGSKSVTTGTDGGVEPSTFVPPKTSRSMTSSLGQRSTDVTRKPTEHTAVISSTEGSKSVTSETVGDAEPSTFVPPKTSRGVTSRLVQQSTVVTRKPAEHSAVISSTEGSKSVTTETVGDAEPSTFVPPKTSRSMTSRVVQQSTVVTRKPTEHTAVRSSTEDKESVTTGAVGDVEPSSFFPPKTSRSVTSRLVQQSTVVTRKPAVHTTVRSSTEGKESVTVGTAGDVEPSSFFPPKTSKSVTSRRVQQSTDVTRKPAVHTTVRSSTEGKESVTTGTDGGAQPSTFVPPKTSRSMTGSLGQQSTDVTRKPTEHTAIRSSTEGSESVITGNVGGVEPSTFFPPKTSRSMTSSLLQRNTDVTRKPTEHITVKSSIDVKGITTEYNKPSTKVSSRTITDTTLEHTSARFGYTTGCPDIPDPTSCRFKNKYFKIGEKFTDPDNPCLKYTCTKEGFTTEVEECVGQKWCKKAYRLYKENNCCYNCANECRPIQKPMKITIKGCSTTVMMAMCSGDCPKSLIYGEIDRQLLNRCSCCQPTGYTSRNIPVICPNGKIEVYTYKHTTSCACQDCTSR